MMYTTKPYTVLPMLPKPLLPLRTVAMNLWWTWNPDAQDLFRRLDPGRWEQLQQNPIHLLNTVDQARLDHAAEDPAFLAHLDRVCEDFEREMEETTWFEQHYPELKGTTVAYFSAEFGMHESVPFYAGGLGVLAGDHLKSASDLGVPLVGVTLCYRQGYFHQRLSHEGRQFEEYPRVDLNNIPVTLVTNDDGSPLKVEVPVADHIVHAQVWKAQVGRIALYCLDTYLPENSPEDRQITDQLYGGDQVMRIRQELVLGFGGVRVLRAVGVKANVFHMNEGHSAFLALERVRELVQDEGLSFAEAREAVAGSTLFTTHTPVPAGIDTFPAELVEKYVGGVAGSLGLGVRDLLSLGQLDASRDREPFSMAILALRLASSCNGVSQLHATVARKMWHPLWRDVPVSEVPISSVTNGIHIRTWQSLEMARLFDRYLGPDWARDPDQPEVWDRVDKIPDSELWRAEERLREGMVAAVRARLREQLLRRGAPPSEIEATDEVLSPEALTIGFARRFAPYKRATLVLQDPERIRKLLLDEARPVQFIFAGKAHPRDEFGKDLIKKIIQFARDPDIRKRIVFLEDYAIGVARLLVHGVDVWLNNPIRMLEASGTSGMKVAPNGGINLSILDGWWPEAYDPEHRNGWAIGDHVAYGDDEYQTQAEAESLYELLENEIVPTFYDHAAGGIPRRWIKIMKASIRTCCAQFSANRMLRDYTQEFYTRAAKCGVSLATGGYAAAKGLAAWKQQLRQHWDQVRLENVQTVRNGVYSVGDDITVTARVHLGEITPDDVAVQVYYGALNGAEEIDAGAVVAMTPKDGPADGWYTYTGKLPCPRPGRHGFAVRVVPCHASVPCSQDMGLIRWA